MYASPIGRAVELLGQGSLIWVDLDQHVAYINIGMEISNLSVIQLQKTS
jgi:hypothetical protein